MTMQFNGIEMAIEEFITWCMWNMKYPTQGQYHFTFARLIEGTDLIYLIIKVEELRKLYQFEYSLEQFVENQETELKIHIRRA